VYGAADVAVAPAADVEDDEDEDDDDDELHATRPVTATAPSTTPT
jgi:hypothetical protein